MADKKLFPADKKEIIAKALKDYELPPAAETYINSLLSGKMKETMLVCCHSGCEICMDTIKQCYLDVKKQLG